jgi:hypothetical protein
MRNALNIQSWKNRKRQSGAIKRTRAVFSSGGGIKAAEIKPKNH